MAEHWHDDPRFDEGCEGCQADVLAGRGGITTRPKIVCLCGSTRFYSAFQEANYRETMAGHIVLSVGFYPHATPEAHGEEIGITPEQKARLDDLHLRKIDLADEVLVLNSGGYIGHSTKREVQYAWRTGKHVRWLEPHRAGALADMPTAETISAVAPSAVGGTDG